MKTLEYSIPAMTLTEKDYKDILWPLLKYYLPRAGFHRKYPRDLLFSTHELQGLNLKNPTYYKEQLQLTTLSITPGKTL